MSMNRRKLIQAAIAAPVVTMAPFRSNGSNKLQMITTSPCDLSEILLYRVDGSSYQLKSLVTEFDPDKKMGNFCIVDDERLIVKAAELVAEDARAFLSPDVNFTMIIKPPLGPLVPGTVAWKYPL